MCVTGNVFSFITTSSELEANQGKETLVDALVERCRRLGIPRVFVFTLAESFFSNCGFQEFQRESLPPVVWVECSKCPKFYRCDEIGMIRTL